MKRTGRALAIAVGSMSILLAVVGLVYNAYAVWRIVGGSPILFKEQLPIFVATFSVMSLICSGCYLFLLWCGIAFLRGRLEWVRPFTLFLIVETGYWLIAYALWRIIALGWSVAAVRALANGGFSLEWSGSVGLATTIANAALVFQFDTLFPLWAGGVMELVRRWDAQPDSPRTAASAT